MYSVGVSSMHFRFLFLASVLLGLFFLLPGTSYATTKAPSVQIDEIPALPQSIEGVETSSPSFICGLPIIGRICKIEEEKVDDVASDFALPYTCCGDDEIKEQDCQPCEEDEDEIEEEEQPSFMCSWFGMWCDDEELEAEEHQDQDDEDDQKEAEEPEKPTSCVPPLFPQSTFCSEACKSGNCRRVGDSACFECNSDDYMDPADCPTGTSFNSDVCDAGCASSCLEEEYGSAICYRCDAQPNIFLCPDDMYNNMIDCNLECTEETKECIRSISGEGALGDNVCFACREKDNEPVKRCPADTFHESKYCSEMCVSGECSRIGNTECFRCINHDSTKPECPDGTVAGEVYECATLCPSGSCESAVDSPDLSCVRCLQYDFVDEPICPEGTFEYEDSCQNGCVNGVCTPRQYDAETCYHCQQCPVGSSSSLQTCKAGCPQGECLARTDLDISCYICQEKQEKVVCEDATYTQTDCASSCKGTCSKVYTRTDGEKCFECIWSEDDIDDGPICPSGTTAEKSDCESQCPSNGTCIGEDGCYSCLVVNCPDGTFKDECPSSCSNGCSVVGQQHGVSCFQCKQDCSTVCAENGYGPENTDHSNAILSELNGYSCVSGANISIQTATIGECNCVGEYSLAVDTKPPVCAGTPCGDIECGGSASCPGGPNETITVNCNWGGWEKIQKHQFRPVIGN